LSPAMPFLFSIKSLTYFIGEVTTQAKCTRNLTKILKIHNAAFQQPRGNNTCNLILGHLNTLYFSNSSLNSSADQLRGYQVPPMKFGENLCISMATHFLFDQTPKNYLIMLGLFSIRISDFYTAWLPKCFVVDFANFGEISGGHPAAPIFFLNLPCCALVPLYACTYPAVTLLFIFALTLLCPYPAFR